MPEAPHRSLSMEVAPMPAAEPSSSYKTSLEIPPRHASRVVASRTQNTRRKGSRGVGTCSPPANYQTARGHGVNADQLPQGVLRARAAARKGQWSVLTGARPAPMPAARNFTRVTRRAPQFAAAARWCSQRPRGPCAPGAASSSPSASTLRGPSQRSRRDAAMASRASAVARVSR